MGKGLQDLGLKDEALPTAGQAMADLPEFGSFAPPPQPGSYRFQLPDDMSAIYDVYDAPKVGGQRIRVVFDKNAPLTIVQSKGGASNGLPFETRLSNEERARGKDKSIVASDVDYLLRALGLKEKPASNKAYVVALQAQAKKQFGADVRYSWRCSTDRNIRVKDAQGNVQEVEGRPGCGNAIYQEDLPNRGVGPDGLVPLQVQCTCGAVLRAFANLDNLRA